MREIVENIAAGYSSRPTREMIVKKAKRMANVFSEFIAHKILEESTDLTPSQLEYVILRGGRAALSEASRLYKIAVKMGREDLVSHLRYLWNTQGPKGMLECPNCGFKAIAPDRSCMICGKVVSEDYIREQLSFNDKFEIYIKTSSVAELNEALNHGYLLLGERGVYSPRSPRARIENPVVYIIYMRRNEVSRIIEEVNSRQLPI